MHWEVVYFVTICENNSYLSGYAWRKNVFFSKSNAVINSPEFCIVNSVLFLRHGQQRDIAPGESHFWQKQGPYQGNTPY